MLSRLTSKERIWVWSATTLGILLRLLPALRSPARLATRPYIEDAFYAFSCARHLAMGHGFTVDGVHATNGVQPLICLLYAPFFWVAPDRWAGLALTFVLQALLQLASTVVLVALVRRLTERQETTRSLTPSVLAAVIWNLSMQLFVHNTNGLETGLVALLLLSITYLLSFELTWARTLLVGVLCGLVVLARIDAALFVAAVCTWMLLRRRWPNALVAGALAVLVSLPWWIYNVTVFGSVMPISGQSESAHALELATIANNVWEAVISLSDIVSVFFYHQRGAIPEWANALWIAIVLVALVYLIRTVHPFRPLRTQAALWPLVWFAACVTIYYTFFFGAPHFLARYLHPVRVLWVILLCVSLPALRNTRASNTTSRFITVFILVIATAFTVQRYVTNFSTTEISDLYNAGVWSAEHPRDRLGMEQSGTSGFVADNVINLDGKVNAEALAAMKAGSDSLGTYVTSHVDYLADWPELIAPAIAAASRDGFSFVPVDTIGRVVVYRKLP